MMSKVVSICTSTRVEHKQLPPGLVLPHSLDELIGIYRACAEQIPLDLAEIL
jgi:hypothetical protein